ncbi:hypothetical protein, partial [Schleiferia thermophila]
RLLRLISASALARVTTLNQPPGIHTQASNEVLPPRYQPFTTHLASHQSSFTNPKQNYPHQAQVISDCCLYLSLHTFSNVSLTPDFFRPAQVMTAPLTHPLSSASPCIPVF